MTFKRQITLMSAALLLAMALFPAADNPSWLRDSAGFHFDAFSKAHNARNLVLYGELNQANDDWKPLLHSPVFTGLQTVVFAVFGPSIASTRLLGMAATLLSLVILMRLLEQAYRRSAALYGGALFTCSQVVLFGGRSGLIEPLLMCFCAGLAWALQALSKSDRPVLRGSLLGLCAAGLLLTKWTGLLFVLALVLTLTRKERPATQSLRWSTIVFLFVMVAAGATMGTLARNEIFRESAFWLSKNPSSKIADTIAQFVLHKKLPGQMLLVLAALPSLLLSFRRQTPTITRYFSWSLLLGLAWLSVGHYRPFRYFIPLMLPLCFLAGASYAQLTACPTEKLRRGTVAGLLLLGALHGLQNIVPYLNWVQQPQYSMRSFSQMAGARWHDAVIAGVSPNFAVMENTHYGLRWEESGVNGAALAHGEWTHLVIPKDFRYPRTFRRRFPDVMHRATRLGTVQIVNWAHEVYALDLQRQSCSSEVPGQWQATNTDAHNQQAYTRLAWTDHPLEICFADTLRLAPGESTTWIIPSAADASLMLPDNFWMSMLDQGCASQHTQTITDFDGSQYVGLMTRRNAQGHYSGQFRLEVAKASAEDPVLYLVHGKSTRPDALQAQYKTHEGTQPVQGHLQRENEEQFMVTYALEKPGTLLLDWNNESPLTLLGRLPYPRSLLIKLAHLNYVKSSDPVEKEARPGKL